MSRGIFTFHVMLSPLRRKGIASSGSEGLRKSDARGCSLADTIEWKAACSTIHCCVPIVKVTIPDPLVIQASLPSGEKPRVGLAQPEISKR